MSRLSCSGLAFSELSELFRKMLLNIGVTFDVNLELLAVTIKHRYYYYSCSIKSAWSLCKQLRLLNGHVR